MASLLTSTKSNKLERKQRNKNIKKKKVKIKKERFTPTQKRLIAAEYFNPTFPGSFSGKSTFLRHTRQPTSRVRKWFPEQDSYTLHRPVRRTFERRITHATAPNEFWQADLADLSSMQNQNRGTRFLLTVIDVFSKYAWVRPLKRKTGTELVHAFSDILREAKPKYLQTDKGTEFRNREFQTLLRQNNIFFFTSQDPVTKASVVERFNRTLKGRMFRYFTYQHTNAYLNVLP